MNRKAIIVVFSIQIIILSMFPIKVSIEAEGKDGSFGGGSGTLNDPYIIEDVWDLQNISSNKTAHYVLFNDINATVTRTWNSGAGFVPIGTNWNSFNGILDGKGHNITGLFINRSSVSNQGLFGYVGSGGLVKNVNLIDNVVRGDTYVGGFIGENRGGTVSNCSATGTVSGTIVVGGLVGFNGGLVSYCYSTGNVSGSGSYIGGFVGWNYQGMVSNCYEFGGVNGYREVGGLVGFNDEGSVITCYESGDVNGHEGVGCLVGRNYGTLFNCSATGNTSGNDRVGGLVGYNYYGTVSNCSFIGNVSGIGLEIGVLVGYNFYDMVSNSHYNVEKVLINGEHLLTYGGLYDSQYQDWISSGKTLNIMDYSSTLVPSGGYYFISTVLGFRDLLGFTDVSSYKFRLEADIDLKNAKGLYIPYFSASEFDGNNHTISNLHINMSFGKYLGVFGYITSSATVHNVNSVEANVEGYLSVGGLVGANDGTLSNCSASGDVNGYKGVGGLVGEKYYGIVTNCFATVDVSGYDGVGGLVGRNYQGTVSICYSTGNVSGDYYVGGLIGENRGGTVSNCYASGDVNGNWKVGGLVGSNQGMVFKCYAIGTVIGSGDYVGGLMGNNYYGTVSHCSATGSVIGSGGYIGGLMGENNKGTVSNCYTSGDVNGSYGVGGLVGRNYQGTVSICYSTGTVRGTEGSVGGLLGYNYGTITNCYAIGNVSGTKYYVGGLVGENTGIISNSYATGDVIRTFGINADFGGFVGFNYRSKILNCFSIGRVIYSDKTDPTDKGFTGSVYTGSGYEMKGNFWDTQTSGQTSTEGNATGKNTTEMMTLKTFEEAGWDIVHVRDHVDEIWYMDEGYDYPKLGWELYRDILSPVAATGPDKTVLMGEMVHFNGSRSSDNNGIVSYTWTFTDGAPITLSGKFRSYRFDNAGVFVVTLNVTDAAGNWDTDTMAVTVMDTQQPFCNAGPDQFINMGDTAHFNASLSTDNVGIVSYTWTFTDGAPFTLSGILRSHKFDNAGVFVVTLNVTDAVGKSAVDTMTVTVWDTEPPIAIAGKDIVIDERQKVTFDAGSSSDNVGIVNYSWRLSIDFIMITLYGSQVEYQFNYPGVFIVRLAVFDAEYNLATATLKVTVRDISSPIANPGPDQRVAVGSTVILDGSWSGDNVGIVRYSWKFNFDGSERTMDGVGFVFVFDKAGTYEIELTVYDEYDHSGKDVVIISVIDTGIVKGTVFDPKGNPVEGAKVEITASNGQSYSTTTGANGSFSLVVFHGNFNWSISKEGYKGISGSSSVKAMGEAQLDLSDHPLVREGEKKDRSSLFLLVLLAVLILMVLGIAFYLLIGKKEGFIEE